MLQNSNKYAYYAAIAFALIFAFAVILYFFPSQGKVDWLEYSNAIESAAVNHKPVLLYPTSKFSTTNKLANKGLFSNDTLVSFIKENFIPTKLDLDDRGEQKIAKKRYMIDDGKFSIILDEYGRGLYFLDNSWSIGVFTEFAKKALGYPLFKLSYFNDAKSKAVEEDKNLLVIVSNSYYQNISIGEALLNEELYEFINSDFIPALLISYEEWDKSILKKYLPENDTTVINMGWNTSSGFKINNVASQEFLLILSPDGNLIKKLNIPESPEKWISEIKSALIPDE